MLLNRFLTQFRFNMDAHVNPMRGSSPPVLQTNESKSPSKSLEGLGEVPQLDSVANVDEVGMDHIGHEKSVDRQTSGSPSGNLSKSTKDLACKVDPATSPTQVKTRAKKVDKKSLDYNNSAMSLPRPNGNGAIAKIRKKVKWSISTRLQIIEAVTKVEEELFQVRSKEGISPAVGRGVRKWGRVAELLGEEFRVQSRGPRSQIGRYKCKSVFDHLIRGYKDQIDHRSGQSSHSLRLTDEEFQLLKRREDLKARFESDAAVQKTSKAHLRGRLRSLIVKQKDDLSDGNSSDSETEESGSCSLTDQTSESESNGAFQKLPQIKGNFATSGRDHIDSEQKVMVIETTDESELPESSLEKVEAEHDGPGKSMEEQFSCPNYGSATSLSQSESNGVARKAKPDARTGVETQARITGIENINAVTRRSASKSVSAERKRTKSSMIEPAYDECIHLNCLERPLKRVDLEFSHLSSWMLNEAIPFAERVMNESTSTAMPSAKKCKVNAQDRPPGGSVTDDFEGLLKNSSKEMTEHQIRALFQKLRIRFAEELKNTCMEIAKEIVEGAQGIQASPCSSRG